MRKIMILMIIIFNNISWGQNIEQKITITNNSVGVVKIGNNYSEFINFFYNNNYNVKRNRSGVHIYQDSTLVLKFSNKNWDNPPYIVKLIEVFSEMYRTSDNVSVGMSIDDLLHIYPNLELFLDGHSASFEYFQIPTYQTDNSDKSINIAFLIIVSSTNNERLGVNYNLKQSRAGYFGYIADSYKTNGVVSRLLIYQMK